MKYRHVMNRRTFLRGTGTVAIGLPFLESMRTTSVYAAEPEPPARALSVFFGLGVPKELQAEGWTGPLAPLAPFADKLALLRGTNLYDADGTGNNHFDGGGGVFVGVEPVSESRSGGPSFDQVLRSEKYPTGVPAGVIPTLMMGSFFRRSRLTRYVHCWNEDGSPTDLPKESPADLFTRVFGDDQPGMGMDPAALKARRYERSILDAVMSQYQTLTSPAGNLSAASQSRLKDHLDRVRELEQRTFGDPPPPPDGTCPVASEPGVMPILNGQDPDPDGEGVDIALDEWVALWRNMVDIYVLAVQCDRTRFGNVMFQSAGERVRLTGRHEYDGALVYDFDDRRDRGVAGSAGCSHEFWHIYRASQPNIEMRHHTHFTMTQLAYFLSRLDDAAYTDENGKTILENALVMIGTELGDGNPHNLESVFHAISGGNDRFKSGIFDVGAEAVDVYNTCLEAYGVGRRLGPAGRTYRRVDSILA